jgi:hypothetical protein
MPRHALSWISSHALTPLPVLGLLAAGHSRKSHVLPYILAFALSAIALGLAGGFVAWARSSRNSPRESPGDEEEEPAA